ncbi:MAG: hypothetical protein K2M63_01145 [Muribaculaceae bacterium]|nr:hypothetical protein [Muribaculaceae bacterium]
MHHLKDYYNYWDNLVLQWRKGEIYNQPYLPEPWWGWTPYSGEPLHSVVINLSPGQGGKLQSRRCVNCALGCIFASPYSFAMAEGILPDHLTMTDHWHLNSRYKPIMRALDIPEEKIPQDTRHHLSIELSPFHDIDDFQSYIMANAQEIFRYTLCFAAEAVKHISRSPDASDSISLKDIVIVRSAPKHIKTIKDVLETGMATDEKIQFLDGEKGFRINEEGLRDVTFLFANGARNRLPKTSDLIGIISNNNNTNK